MPVGIRSVSLVSTSSSETGPLYWLWAKALRLRVRSLRRLPRTSSMLSKAPHAPHLPMGLE